MHFFGQHYPMNFLLTEPIGSWTFLMANMSMANIHGEAKEFYNVNVAILSQNLEPERAFQLFSLSSKDVSQEL